MESVYELLFSSVLNSQKCHKTEIISKRKGKINTKVLE